MHRFYASCPKSLESLLAEELQSLGAARVRPGVAGVAFEAEMEGAYRACLWSRLASRILIPIAEFDARSPEELYAGVRRIRWSEHFPSPAVTFRVDASLRQSQMTHSQFAALKVKDAIVDQFRDERGTRPSVSRERPDFVINLFMNRDRATLSLDLGGRSLHQRGYRREQGEAPLKENLAAALLLRAGWPEIARGEGTLVDPMCGSGTLLIEGALMAADIAPGLTYGQWGFLKWKKFDSSLWKKILEEAKERRRAGLERKLPLLLGWDADRRIIRVARENASRAGLGELIRFESRSLEEGDHLSSLRADVKPGLLITNPPYGERMGEAAELVSLYVTLGKVLREGYRDWKAAVLTSQPALGKQMGLRAAKKYRFFNGSLECELLLFDVGETAEIRASKEDAKLKLGSEGPEAVLSENAVMFKNRLSKMARHFGKWVRKEGLECYRVYDADIPEYNAAIDIYRDALVIQEYAAPKTVSEAAAQRRFQEILLVAPEVLGVDRGRVRVKVRQRQKGTGRQYEKNEGERALRLEVHEYGRKFEVNLSDYLDTGLFLDHRAIRKKIGEESEGKRFLNLFAYTGSATVYAATAGARRTVTVDMSWTYLEWAQRNLKLNGIRAPSKEHALVQADCLAWLEEGTDERFDLIFLDPPTFSVSKRMEGSLDTQRDHVKLIRLAARLLAPGGKLYFSTNFTRFKLDEEALQSEGLAFKNISKATIPQDFQRNPRIHYCWAISKTD